MKYLKIALLLMAIAFIAGCASGDKRIMSNCEKIGATPDGDFYICQPIKGIKI